jgi:hypothetical protein
MTTPPVANGHTLSDSASVTLTCRLVTLRLAATPGKLEVWLWSENRALAVTP